MKDLSLGTGLRCGEQPPVNKCRVPLRVWRDVIVVLILLPLISFCALREKASNPHLCWHDRGVSILDFVETSGLDNRDRLGSVFRETICKSQASCASSYNNIVVRSILSWDAEVVASYTFCLVSALACGAAPAKLMLVAINKVNFILEC